MSPYPSFNLLVGVHLPERARTGHAKLSLALDFSAEVLKTTKLQFLEANCRLEESSGKLAQLSPKTAIEEAFVQSRSEFIRCSAGHLRIRRNDVITVTTFFRHLSLARRLFARFKKETSGATPGDDSLESMWDFVHQRTRESLFPEYSIEAYEEMLGKKLPPSRAKTTSHSHSKNDNSSKSSGGVSRITCDGAGIEDASAISAHSELSLAQSNPRASERLRVKVSQLPIKTTSAPSTDRARESSFLKDSIFDGSEDMLGMKLPPSRGKTTSHPHSTNGDSTESSAVATGRTCDGFSEDKAGTSSHCGQPVTESTNPRAVERLRAKPSQLPSRPPRQIQATSAPSADPIPVEGPLTLWQIFDSEHWRKLYLKYRERLQDELKDQHVDQAAGFHVPEEYKNPDQPFPTVELCESEENGRIYGIALYNACSTFFLEEAEEDDRHKPFLSGKAGRGNTLVRIATTVVGRLMLCYRIGPWFYAGIRATSFEKRKLTVLNYLARIYYEVTLAYLEELRSDRNMDSSLIDRVQVGLYRANTLQEALGGMSKMLYKSHSDASPLTTSTMDPNCFEDFIPHAYRDLGDSNHPRLHRGPSSGRVTVPPTRRQLMTYTMVRANYVPVSEEVLNASGDPVSPYLCQESSCFLRFHDPTIKKTPEIATTNNCIHIQTEGVQADCEHSVKCVVQADGHTYRAVSSGRLIHDPNVMVDKDDYESICRQDAMHRNLDPENMPYVDGYLPRDPDLDNPAGLIDYRRSIPAEDDSEEEGLVKPTMLEVLGFASKESDTEVHTRSAHRASPSANSDSLSLGTQRKWKNIPFRLFELYQFDRQVKTVAIDSPAHVDLSSASMTRMLMQLPTPIHLFLRDGSVLHPVLWVFDKKKPHLPELLSMYQSTAVRQTAGKLDSVRSHPFICFSNGATANHTTMLFLTRDYKQDLQSLQKAVLDLVLGYPKQRGFETFGCGGSNEAPGSHAPPLHICGPGDATVIIRQSQNAAKGSNEALHEFSLKDTVAAVFASCEVLVLALASLPEELSMSDLLLIKKFLRKIQTRDSSDVAFMGFQYFRKITWLNPLSIEDDGRRCAATQHETFKDNGHVVVEMSPLFYRYEYDKMVKASRARNYNYASYTHRVEPKAALIASFPELEMGQLLLVTKEQVRKRYVETVIQPSIDQADHSADECNPAFDMLIASGKDKYRLEIDGLVNLNCLVQCAGDQRFLCLCIDGNGLAKPLDDKSLGQVLQIHAIPDAHRGRCPLVLVMLGAASGYLQLMNQGSLERICFDPNDGKHVVGLRDLLLTAITGRTSGDMTAIEEWRLYLNDARPVNDWTSMDRFFPSLDEIPEFLRCIRATTKGRKTISRWQSKQHEHAIPSSLKTPDGYANFLSEVSKRLEGFIQEFLKEREGGAGRREIRDSVVEFLIKCTPSGPSVNREKYLFLSHLILSDLEEVFVDPFGAVTLDSIHAGHGSQQCAKLMVDLDGALYKDRSKLYSDLLEHMGNPDMVSKHELDMLGLERVGKSVCWKLNGRPIGFQDIEHFLCKGYIVLSKTHASRTISKHPFHTEPHCHPVAFRDRARPAWGRLVNDKCLKLCQASAKALSFHPPMMPKSAMFVVEAKLHHSECGQELPSKAPAISNSTRKFSHKRTRSHSPVPPPDPARITPESVRRNVKRTCRM